ncbi:flagellar assembly protein FliW [Paenibacillus sp. JSM ZJ436]|uniref:flagellar assembly protein FliW n=1 Tax=Paenibacillus sp. JSM ZJ436 TaxID=3376190 RepID=UPI0037B4201A
MIIDTGMWGQVEVQEDAVYVFEKGLPGFEEEHRFALIEAEYPFAYLQSLQDKELAFVVADPFTFYPEYDFELPEYEVRELELGEEVIVRCILTLKEQPDDSSINLLAPVVMNPQQRLGKQIILHHTSYRARHSLIRSEQASEPKGGV